MAPPDGYVVTPFWMQPTRSPNDTDEFRTSYAAVEMVNALYALDSGHTGQGVTVAVTDDGVVNVNHELDGRISSLSKDFGSVTSGGVTTKRNAVGDDQSDHGTAVANIIGAAANGVGTVGYAPNVTIAALRISDYDADSKTETLTLGHLVEAIDYAGEQHIKVISSSLGTGGSLTWGNAVTRFAATGGLVVHSAGNTAGDSPADAAAINDSNRHAVLFVGALDPNIESYTLASYSAKAGSMADRYVVAVGTQYTTLLNGTVGIFTGTSSAVPTVAGLVADILSKWPQLSGQQAGDIVLNTAKDIGAPGVDAVFGHGLVDFKAALSPVNPTLSNGVAQTSLASSATVAPDAIGTSEVKQTLANVTLLDSYGRDYSGSVANMVVKPNPEERHRVESRLRQMGNETSLSFAGISGTIGFSRSERAILGGSAPVMPVSGDVAYAFGNLRVRAAWNGAESLQSDTLGLAPFADSLLAYSPQANTTIGVDAYVGGERIGFTVATGDQAGGKARALSARWGRGGTELRFSFIDEVGTVMGAPTGTGALRLGSGARSAVIEAHRSWSLSARWQVEGYGSLGLTRLKIADNSLVTGASSLLSSRFGVQATGYVLGGRLSLGLSQPLVVESGTARLTYGTGYDANTQSLTFGNANANLKGSRSLQLTGGYSTGGVRSSFRLGAMHDVTNGSTSVLGGWSLRW